MGYKQLVKPNLNTQDYYGWCMRLVRTAFGAPATAPTATDGADASEYRHSSRTLPKDVSVPVWFTYSEGSWSPGHVVISVPGKGLMSSPKSGYGVFWYKTIEECERAIGGKYRFWSEDINGVRVVQPVKAVSKPAVKPSKPTVQTVKLLTNWYTYKTAADAKNMRNIAGKLPAGTYKITHTSGGVPHLENVNGLNSGWVHPSVLGKATAKPVKKPAIPTLRRVKLLTAWYTYRTAADAKAMVRIAGKLPKGTYEVTHTSNGVPHLRSLDGKHYGWVHPSVLS